MKTAKLEVIFNFLNNSTHIFKQMICVTKKTQIYDGSIWINRNLATFQDDFQIFSNCVQKTGKLEVNFNEIQRTARKFKITYKILLIILFQKAMEKIVCIVCTCNNNNNNVVFRKVLQVVMQMRVMRQLIGVCNGIRAVLLLLLQYCCNATFQFEFEKKKKKKKENKYYNSHKTKKKLQNYINIIKFNIKKKKNNNDKPEG
eukprot:TRINITY_DN10035_c0_g3_i1.p1 TRINITY_DN10035_c0_g3~~TRINITY_DN10035_c0_g3_i1.p1  ORF type:complete len:201 (-),score=17.73 TRINITY_DN10035_c0_g3_i1:78-680(-)